VWETVVTPPCERLTLSPTHEKAGCSFPSRFAILCVMRGDDKRGPGTPAA